MKRLFLAICLFAAANASLWAQSTCSQNLLAAQRKYDQGLLSEVDALLSSCIQEGFSKAERLQAYRLLILSNLFLDESEKAEELMFNLLKLEPNYKANVLVDPSEYLQLYNSYRAVPVFAVGLRGGVNSTSVRILNRYNFGNTDQAAETYSNIPSLSFGISTYTTVYKRLLLTVDFLYASRSYALNDPFLDFVLLYEEILNTLEIPIGLSYVLRKGNYKPYVSVGIAPAFLLAANATADRSRDNGTKEATGPALEIDEIRKDWNISGYAAAGLRKKFGRSEVFAEARYYRGFTNIPVIDKRYSNVELVYRYGHIDNDFTLNNLMISAGFIQNFYHVKKVKQKATR